MKDLKTVSALGIGALATIGVTASLPNTYEINEVDNTRVVLESSCNGDMRYFVQKENGKIVGSTSNTCSLEYMKNIDNQYEVEEITFEEWKELHPDLFLNE